MRNPGYLERMEQHELLFATPITQGTYVWRSRGIQMVQRVGSILENAAKRSFPDRIIEDVSQKQRMILDRTEYDEFFRDINPYGNNFVVNFGTHE